MEKLKNLDKKRGIPNRILEVFCSNSCGGGGTTHNFFPTHLEKSFETKQTPQISTGKSIVLIFLASVVVVVAVAVAVAEERG